MKKQILSSDLTCGLAQTRPRVMGCLPCVGLRSNLTKGLSAFVSGT